MLTRAALLKKRASSVETRFFKTYSFYASKGLFGTTHQQSNNPTQQPTNPPTQQPNNPTTNRQPNNPTTQKQSNPTTQESKNPRTQQHNNPTTPGWEGGDTFLSRSAGFCLIVVNVPWRVRGVAPSAPRAPEVRLLWSDNFRHFVVRGVLLNVDSGFWLLGFAIQS